MDLAEAQLQARKIAEQTGLSMAEIASLSLDQFARLSGRPTPAEAARAAFEAQHEQVQAQAPAVPQSTPQPPDSQPQGLDPDSPEFFHAWRAQRVSGGEGRGIFDSVGSQSAEYRSAARKHAGRTGYGHEVHAVVPRAFVRQDDRLDHRSASARFSNQSTMWQGR
jgi:hypothetical protein